MKISSNTEVRMELSKILTEPTVYPYDSYSTLDSSKEETLSLYIKEVDSTEIGKKMEVYFETILPFKEISFEEKKLVPVRRKVALGPFYAHIFEKPPLDDFIGILAGNRISKRLATILSILVKKKIGASESPLREVKIPFYLKQEDIRKIQDFQDVKEIIVEDIYDPFVEWAWMKGSSLDQSDEFKKFVEGPSAGKIKLLAVHFIDRDYYIYEDGRMFTRQAKATSGPQLNSEISLFFEIGKRLHTVGALI
jgi:hypothetical protein